MSDQNIFLSNGTCYTGPGQKLHESFIPCGNAAFGHITCCGAGDNCLADDACWGIHGTGYGRYLTYMAGCTDPEYKDPNCPKKIIGEYLAKSFRPCVRFLQTRTKLSHGSRSPTANLALASGPSAPKSTTRRPFSREPAVAAPTPLRPP